MIEQKYWQKLALINDICEKIEREIQVIEFSDGCSKRQSELLRRALNEANNQRNLLSYKLHLMGRPLKRTMNITADND